MGNVRPSIADVLAEVASEYATTIHALIQSDRHARISEARQLAMFLVRQATGMPYQRIGRGIGNRDHNTVWTGAHQTERRLAFDMELAERATRIQTRLGMRMWAGEASV